MGALPRRGSSPRAPAAASCAALKETAEQTAERAMPMLRETADALWVKCGGGPANAPSGLVSAVIVNKEGQVVIARALSEWFALQERHEGPVLPPISGHACQGILAQLKDRVIAIFADVAAAATHSMKTEGDTGEQTFAHRGNMSGIVNA